MKIMVYEHGKGYAAYTHKIANELSDQGNTVIYVSSSDNSYRDSLNSNVINKCVLKTPNKDIKRKSIKWIADRFLVMIWNSVERNRLIKQYKPDVVNIHSMIPLIDRFCIKKSKNITYAMTIHNVVPHKKDITDIGTVGIWKKQDALIVHTEENKKELDYVYGINENLTIIPHGVDSYYEFMEKVDCRKELDIEVSEKVVLFFGAIKDYKGLDILIQALKGLDIFLLIAGHTDGSFIKYQNLLNEYGIRNKCIIEFIPEEKLPVLFQAADVVVLPYKFFHSQSGVLMQIAKYRRAVIATDVGGFKSFINKYGTGVIVKPNDVNELKDSIISFFDNEEMIHIYENACSKVIDDCSWEKVGELYNITFKEVTAK